MKTLNGRQRQLFYDKRHKEFLNFEETAAVLNCNKEQMVAAQIGSDIPDEVYKAVTQWIGEG